MPEYNLDWNKYTKAAIDLACEGTVLLENHQETLPLNKGRPLRKDAGPLL